MEKLFRISFKCTQISALVFIVLFVIHVITGLDMNALTISVMITYVISATIFIVIGFKLSDY